MTMLISTNRNYIQEFIRNFESHNTKLAYSKDLQDFEHYLLSSKISPYDLTFGTFLNYKDFLISTNIKPTSVGRKLSSIKSFLSWCVTQNLIRQNPIVDLKLPKAVVTRPTLALTDEEIASLLALGVDSYTEIFHNTILHFLLFLGLRRAELVNIKLKDMYEDSGTSVVRILGKGSKPRLIPITDDIKNVINRYLSKHSKLNSEDYLFQASNLNIRKAPIDVSTVYKLVKSKCKELGINKRISPHSCRATVISHLLEQNVSLRNIADFAGHSNVQTTMIYDKKRDGLKNSAAFKVSYGGK